MTLAELFPKGYLVAQAWRKWFDTDKPPFRHFEALREWGERWFLLVQHEVSLTNSDHIPRAYGPWETAVLGFNDDPKMSPMPSRNLWDNADNRVLKKITADRAEIATALGRSEHLAGLFVLTGWVQRAQHKQLVRKLAQPAQASLQTQKCHNG